jgi:hypothetical protein
MRRWRSTRGWHRIFQLSDVREQLYAFENRVIGGCVLRLQEGYFAFSSRTAFAYSSVAFLSASLRWFPTGACRPRLQALRVLFGDWATGDYFISRCCDHVGLVLFGNVQSQ